MCEEYEKQETGALPRDQAEQSMLTPAEEAAKDTPEEQAEALIEEPLQESEDGTVENQDEAVERPKGAFVIKARAANPDAGILRTVTAAEFLAEHPELTLAEELTGQKRPLLVISERARQEIKKHIDWARKTRRNIQEQGGILIGTPFLVDGRVVCVVECVIPAELSESNAAYLKMGTETWTKMLNIYDEQYKEQKLYVVGWFHTHPNGLAVFMSSTDMGTQRAFFREEWHFSVVLNPHRRLIACFHSAQAHPCAFYPSDFVNR